jgi:hypothetical protein
VARGREDRDRQILYIVFCSDEHIFIWYFITSKPTSEMVFTRILFSSTPTPTEKIERETFVVKLAEVLVLHAECG